MNSAPQNTSRLSFKSDLLFLISVVLWLSLYQTILRGLFLYTHYSLASSIPALTLLKAFGIGLRFDLMIAGIAILPMVFGLLFSTSPRKRNYLRIWLTVFFSVVTFLAVLELDFYKEFHQRLNSLVFEYMKEDPKTVLSMIWFGFPVLRYLALIGVLVFIFHKIVGWLDQKNRHLDVSSPKTVYRHIMRVCIFLVVLVLTLIASSEEVVSRPSR